MSRELSNKYIPQLKGLVDARVEQELYRAFTAMYRYFDIELKNIENKSTSTAVANVREQLNLFAARFATPLIEPTGDTLATISQEEGALVAGDIPNLDASKIVSGTFPLARLDGDVLKTDNNLAEDTTGAPNVNTGFTIIKDNAGNSRKVMTCT
jgi:hypothetical protein